MVDAGRKKKKKFNGGIKIKERNDKIRIRGTIKNERVKNMTWRKNRRRRRRRKEERGWWFLRNLCHFVVTLSVRMRFTRPRHEGREVDAG